MQFDTNRRGVLGLELVGLTSPAFAVIAGACAKCKQGGGRFVLGEDGDFGIAPS